MLQVLTPVFDPDFSQHSYGFRPGRSALEAVKAAQGYVQEGRTYVVDIDLERFFDRVNHDVLMGRLAKKIEDKRVLKLVRRYLNAGMMADGVVHQREEGTPQGGPMSPLLANVLLDEVDKALEASGHAFCRYADDLNVYVKSQRAGERVMARLAKMFNALKLRVNQNKSAVGRPWERKFLGFTLVINRHGKVQRTLSPQAITRMKDRVRELTSRSRGRSLEYVGEELRRYLRGWRQYYGHTEIRQALHTLDNFVHRRLRGLLLKQWKHGPTVFRNLTRAGVSDNLAIRVAMHAKRIGWLTHQSFIYVAMPAKLFALLQLPKLAV
jgi:group II intron reverse transcriptase/maturase